MAYKDDMQIDDNQLLFEVERQPHLFHQAASDYADAQYEQEKAKDTLDTVRAKIDEEIRADPGAYKLSTDKKPTESAILNQVIQTADYQEANDSLMEANHLVRTLGAAKDAFGHKKSMLEVAAKLHLADWSAAPSVSAPAREAVAEGGQKEHLRSLPKPRLGKAGK